MRAVVYMVLVSSLAACEPATRSAAGDGTGNREDVNPADRKILGVPAPYAADVDYTQPPVPRLSDEDAAWARQLLAARTVTHQGAS